MPKRPIRFFNTAGPCNPDEHYMLPPAERLIGAQLHRYISDKLYWSLHAPRKTGKTTFLQSWMCEINAGAEAIACYVSVERCQGISETSRAMPAICTAIQDTAKRLELPVPLLTTADNESLLNNILGNWAELVAPKPLIVLFDEVDVLQDATLISFLRQLRDGYATRGVGKFPTSIALVGMRDLKDYITASKGGVAPNPGSPFNIKQDSAVIGNFSQADIARLFAQRTAETGQQITPEALDYVYDQSRGQPWIVNSLFMRATMRVLDTTSTESVTLAHVAAAREQMVLARETHLDALAYRMQDPRVRRVMESLITGAADPLLAETEGFRLCLDLGLVSIERGTPQVSTPLYREVLARHMTYGPQLAITEPTFRWQKPDGSLDMDSLLREFQKFWRRNSEIWEQTSNYTEAFPHLLLMAFLQRVTNGGGRIEREYAAGRGRLDLLVEYEKQSNIIEIKIIRDHDTPEIIREEGLGQVRAYRDKMGSAIPAYLIIFDRRSKALQLPWDQRIQWQTDGDVTVIGC
ncbi:PD-(D/E)XK nuclease domain-containing protein [Termitidicoccus mucosus]|uniref:AAA+ ATPase domain-containing protein n=1 Tax=Termitidicoccus mucosus TaxID=1184151 RepID=A0A178IQY3_9BACT|nr:hypothetical protein AW736_02085 [Opitutaceae bacterium TSB47]